MDVLTDVLKTVVPSGGGFGRRTMQAPWGVAVPRSDLAIVHIVVRGDCWLTLADNGKPVRLRAGHLAMLAHGHPHSIASDPDGAKGVPVERPSCALANVDHLPQSGTVLACGYFNVHGRQSHPLLSVLPPLVHLKKGDAGQWLGTTVRMLAKNSGGPGEDALLDQLAGVLFIEAVRAYVQSLTQPAEGWLAAIRDPSVGRALEQIHADPARDWTVASLAASVAMSRTEFADRFTRTTGQTPMAYVRCWRMHRAAHLLRTEGLSVIELCERVGYRSEATFAKAFKRHTGKPPAAYRRHAMAAAAMDQGAVRAQLLGTWLPISTPPPQP